MMIFSLKYVWRTFGAFLLLVGVGIFFCTFKKQMPIDYWIWAGIRPENHMSKSALYMYQGNLRVLNGETSYERLGLYPHPCSNKIYIVYRIIGGLPSPSKIAKLFEVNANLWARHNVNVIGLQLDFDSPTAKLLQYSHFLFKIRKCLPAPYQLSITGLADWVLGGDQKVLQQISKNTNEIVFQLYQGHKHYGNIDTHIRQFFSLNFSFKVGLLASQAPEKYIKMLENNPYFRGTILFVQKTKER